MPRYNIIVSWFIARKAEHEDFFVAFLLKGGGWMGYVTLSFPEDDTRSDLAVFATKAKADACAVGLVIDEEAAEVGIMDLAPVGVYRTEDYP